jgi:hypothetical protein
VPTQKTSRKTRRPGTVTVATDGFHKVIRRRVTRSPDGSWAPGSGEQIAGLLRDAARSSTIAGALDHVEQYWRTVPTEAQPKPLSKGWYAKEILRRVDWVRGAATDPSGVLRDDTPPLEFWLVVALNLGALVEEANWKFHLGEVAKVGVRARRQRQEASQSAVRERKAAATRTNETLRSLVTRYRLQHLIRANPPRWD